MCVLSDRNDGYFFTYRAIYTDLLIGIYFLIFKEDNPRLLIKHYKS